MPKKSSKETAESGEKKRQDRPTGRHSKAGDGEVHGRQTGRKGRNVAQRTHEDLVTVAFRGPLAQKMRTLAEAQSLSLAKLIQDAILVYEQQVGKGYKGGTMLAEWKAKQGKAEE